MVKRILGQYKEAERLYLDALKMMDDHDLGDSEEYTNLLNNAGVFYLSLGIYDQAQDYLDRSRQRRLNNNGQASFQYMESLNNRAFLAQELNKPDEAGEIYLKLLETMEKKGLQSHPNYNKTLKNYCSVLIDDAKHDDAARILQKVCVQQRKEGRQNTTEYIAFLEAYAKALSGINGDEAGDIIGIYDEALAIMRKQGLNNTLQYTKLLSGKSEEWMKKQLWTEAYEGLNEALFIQGDLLRGMAFNLSEQEALQLLKNIRHESGLALNLLVTHFSHDDHKIKEIYQNIALRKSAVLEITLMQQRVIRALNVKDRDKAGKEHISDEQELLSLLDRYKNLKGSSGKESESDREKAERLAAFKRTEKELLIRLNDGERVSILEPVDLKKVCGKMEEDTLILDFYHDRLTEQYLLFTLSAKEELHLFQIGPVQEIDQQIDNYRRLIGESTDPDVMDQAAKRLYKRFFRFLKTAKMKMPAKLILSTIGNLSKCPFETLITDKGEYLTDVTLVKYIPTIKEIKDPLGITESKTAVIITDPDYDYPEKSPDNPKNETNRGVASTSGINNQSEGYRRLHGTKIEGERIAALMKEHNWQLKTHLCEKEAVEKRVKAITGTRIIHMATHGFFKRDDLKINPLHKSGLVLTGINCVLKQPEAMSPEQQEEIRDATLSAYDMVNMNLHGTQLLALSACETGLGEYVPGNGIIGLQRAAFLAGVQSMVMTLWKIPDRQTVTFMEIFYRKYLQTLQPERALKEARDEMINRLTAEKGYADPYIWGAFVYLDRYI